MIIRKSLNHLSKYDVTPDGKVYLNEKELKQQEDSKGYKCITLRTDYDGRCTFKVHRLVAAAYIHNPDPDVFNTVNHKDGRKVNNNALNLEWCTNLQNMRHAIETGLVVCSRPGVQNGRALITEDKVKLIRDLKGAETYANISKLVGISKRQVEKIARNEAWKHVENT